MRDKSLIMAEAMDYIDDRFLEEAHPEACGLTQAWVDRNKMLRRIAAVACICLVALGVSKLPALIEWNKAGSAAPEADHIADGFTGTTSFWGNAGENNEENDNPPMSPRRIPPSSRPRTRGCA